jgi:hypothetical protein
VRNGEARSQLYAPLASCFSVLFFIDWGPPGIYNPETTRLFR